MSASIIFTQGGISTPAGKARIVQKGIPVVCTNQGTASKYLWTLLDIPLRSQLTRDQTSENAAFSFTPDVPGTYLISLRTNNSNFQSENTTSFCAVLTDGEKAMGWRYRASGEAKEDNIAVKDFDGNSLGFLNNLNTRGWATQDDLEREQIEEAVWEVTNASNKALTSGKPRLVRLDSITGRLDPSLAPAFVYTQAQPAAVWTITHNMGRYPVVGVVLSTKEEVKGFDTVHTTVNTVKLTFSKPISGTATCK